MTDEYNKIYSVFRIEYSIKGSVEKSVATVSAEDKENAINLLENKLMFLTQEHREDFSFLSIKKSKRYPHPEEKVMYPLKREDIIEF